MSIKEELKEFYKIESPSEEMAEWGLKITKKEDLEELHDALLELNLKSTSTQFLICMIFLLNWNTSEIEIDLICSVNKDTSTRWIRNDFAKRACSIMKSRGESEIILSMFEKE